MEVIQTFKGSWPWPWPWIRPYGIPSCITHRPLPVYKISLKSKKLFVDGQTDVRTDVRTDGHFPPLILLGRLLEVDLKRENRKQVGFGAARVFTGPMPFPTPNKQCQTANRPGILLPVVAMYTLYKSASFIYLIGYKCNYTLLENEWMLVQRWFSRTTRVSQYQNISLLDFTPAKDNGSGGDN